MATEQASGRLPGFTIFEVAGRGGMGLVYRAEQTNPRRIVALKFLGSEGATPENLATFRREAQVIASLEHPHIVPLYGFGEHAGQPYLVMRYLNGGSAASRLEHGPVEAATAGAWVRAVALALDFAHGRGLVHRDVKPSNILLDTDGLAYLSDFGIAGSTLDPGSGTAAGSAAYMSPEQGRGAAVDHRADIYALAVTLFELLTGQKPYTAETALGVIVRHIHDPVPSARAINAGISPALEALIQRGMAKAASDRPHSAREFARLLSQALSQPDFVPTGATIIERAAQPGGAGATVMKPATAEPTLLERAPDAQRTRVEQAQPRAVPMARRNRPMLWMVVALAGACLLGAVVLAAGGGLGLAALLMPTAERTLPAATGQVTTPAAATPTVAGPGLLLVDDFSNARSGFGAASDEDGGVAYAGGALRMSVLTEGIEWRSLSGRVEAADVRVTVDVRQVTGPPATTLAIICRWEDAENYAALAVSAGGQHAIWRVRGGRTERLVAWADTPGASLADGANHRLAADCAGDRLTLTLDGQVLAEAIDPAPAAGDVGLLAGLRQAGELTAEFDNLEVRAAD